jgi:hypothetical protein
MKYHVYWYYLEGTHTDPYSEGYIGVTNNLERRHLEHIRKAKDLNNNQHFYNAIRKHNWNSIEKKILHTVSAYEEASELEYLYRALPNLGWNMAVGGYENVGEHQKTPIQLYHHDNPELTLSYDSLSQAADTLGISASRLTAAKKRERSVYGLDGYAILFDENFDRSLTKTISEVLSETITGLKRNSPSHFKGMRNRWTDEQKARIGAKHKGKVISEENKEITRIKNRENHPMCKSVVLVHKDNPSKEYKFHSISQASRELQLPLSRLKSKVRTTLGAYGLDGWAVISLGSE